MHLVPAPAGVIRRAGETAVSHLTALTANRPEAAVVAERFRCDLSAWTGVALPATRVSAQRAAGEVRVELTEPDAAAASPLADGAYSLRVDASGVRVAAGGAEGLYRGLTTVVQAIATGGGLLPHVEIDDAPRYSWRGLSLDVARRFVPLDEVRRVIDMLALYKFDVLHLHLTDNEGWRLQIPAWPALTPAGEREYYALDEYADLVAYASERFVTIVPEIDLPGHVAWAIRAYPELNPGAGEHLDGFVPLAYLDVDSPDAWRFVDDVITTLARATPGPYLHVGGDEAFGMPEHEYARFVTETVRIARREGKRTHGFQETSRADVPAGHAAQYWMDFSFTAPEPGAAREGGTPVEILRLVAENFAIAAYDPQRIIDKGLTAVMSPSTRAYLDRPHGDGSLDPAQESARSRRGMQFYPPAPLRGYRDWDPAAVLPGLDPANVLGVEAAVWGESLSGMDDLEVLLMPRLTAIAEVAWSPAGDDWDDYRARLAPHAAMWDRAGWQWYRADSIPWRHAGA